MKAGRWLVHPSCVSQSRSKTALLVERRWVHSQRSPRDRVVVQPRYVYQDAIKRQARADVLAPSTPSTPSKFLSEQEPGTKRWRKQGRSRKKIVSETMQQPADAWVTFYAAVKERENELERVGIDLEVIPLMRVGLSSTATTVDLVAPIVVHSKEHIRALATLSRRLLTRETTLADEWPGYRYGRDAWLWEARLRNRRQAVAEAADQEPKGF